MAIDALRKFGSFISGTNAEEEDYDEDYNYMDDTSDEDSYKEDTLKYKYKAKPNKRYSSDTYKRVDASVISTANFFYPESVENCEEYIELLRSKHLVQLCLRRLDSDTKQRIIDVLSGACRAIDAGLEMFGDCDTLIIAPNGFKLEGQFDDHTPKKQRSFKLPAR